MSKIKVIKASAGSGKTFKLVVEYMKLLFENSESFQNILAVTFTNRATTEMKVRIIEQLYKFSTNKESEYLPELIDILKISENALRKKADIILRKILHNYSKYSICTIDSFFQKIIRSFSKELGIQGGYSIELDIETVLRKAIDDMFWEVDDDDVLRKWLVEFAEAKIEEGGSWDLKRQIVNFGNEVFKEEFKRHSKKLEDVIQDKAKLQSYISKLQKIRFSFEKYVQKLATEALEKITDSKLEIDDFFQKNSGPAGYFLKLKNGKIELPTQRTLDAMDSVENWYAKSSNKKNEITNIVSSDLLPLLKNIVNYFTKEYSNYESAKIIFGNIYSLGIITDISKYITTYARDHNIFLISDSAEFIYRIIDKNDAPFIYEKVGTYLKNIMIDEFQDTSDFQWENFKPLIQNSLAENNDNLVVGDVKQSIYRWRNSNWEILSREVFKSFSNKFIKEEILQYNWRSHKNLVFFNNEFFKRALPVFFRYLQSATNKNEEITGLELYKDIEQKIPQKGNKSKGFISMGFFDEENYEESVFRKTLNTIIVLLNKGYKPGDIAILTREKKRGRIIIDFILQQKLGNKQLADVNIVSEESLFLSNSPLVQFIIFLFTYLVNPNDKINKYNILFYYQNYVLKDKNQEKSIVPFIHQNGLDEAFKTILPSTFINRANEYRYLPLYELTEHLMRIFELGKNKGSVPYIQGLLDQIHSFSDKNLSGIFEFLEFWHEKGSQQSVSETDTQNAIKVLTIHKSKGLEFPIVIFPFCDFRIDKSGADTLWCSTTHTVFNELPVIPVPYTKKLENSVFAKDYYIEKTKNYIDSINLLYVSFTRAKEGLFCFSIMSNKTTIKLSRVSQVLFDVMKDLDIGEFKEVMKEEPHYYSYSYGELPSVEKKAKSEDSSYKTFERLESNTTVNRLNIAGQGAEFLFGDEEFYSPLNYGKIVHEVLENIQVKEDVNKAINKIWIEGKINENEKQKIYEMLNELFSDLQILNWFSGDWKVLNERDIVIPGSETKRPDRIMMKNNDVIVVDYKLSKKHREAYKKQVNDYCDLLKNMLCKNVEGYLLYVDLGEVEKVC